MDDLKRLAAEAAMAELDMVGSNLSPGDRLRIGLGTGSTARHFVDLLGRRVAGGLECICVPTSARTARQAQSLAIPLADLEQTGRLHITVDGTDEIAPDMSLIKGGGGALLREKIVAAASDRMVVIADEGKRVEFLGTFPLPIEVNSFGLSATRDAIAGLMEKLGLEPRISLRLSPDQKPFVTDGSHLIMDACFGRICDAIGLSGELLEIPGVVQHGLFLNLCQVAYLAGPGGVSRLEP